MTLLEFSTLLIFISYFAGILGALTGLGGGIVLIPILVLFLNVNIYYAMGASLIAVIATSSGSAISYLKDGYTNLRIGMFLETAAIIGALIGLIIISSVNKNSIGIIFGIVLLFSAYFSWKRYEDHEVAKESHPWAKLMKMNGDYPVYQGRKNYYVQNVPLAWVVMLFAGMLSSLLGIGAGALKVLAMDQIMRLPYKVATATSNFIIGITASVSVGVYFSRGYIEPVLTFSIVLGVLLGSITGAKILHHAKVQFVRNLFCVVIVFLALQIIYKGMMGEI